MRPAILTVIVLCFLQVSCYKPYDPNIEASERILVVDGLITNDTSSYKVTLTYASPFDSGGTHMPVRSAKVYVTDNTGGIYFFSDKGSGNYMSDSLLFIGKPGNVYTLYVTTMEGDRYESDSQRLLPDVHPDSMYADFEEQEILSRITGRTELTHGGNILADIGNDGDTLPRFRLSTNLVTEYFYKICPPFSLCDLYYNWQTENANEGINLTGGEYSTNTASVNKHSVCFIDDNLYCFSLIDFKLYMISARLIYVKLYSLNNEAYLYYKKMNELLRSDGKLFDPIAAQLNGNIKCITGNTKKVFGFFEVSSVSKTSYTVDFRNLNKDRPSVTEIPWILPPVPVGFWINKIPPFWIN